VTVGTCVAFVTYVVFARSTRQGVLFANDDRPMGARVAEVAQFLVSRAHEAFCGLRGHHMLLQFEPNRLSLRCLTCGAETPGWPLEVSPYLRLRRPRVVVKATAR